METPASETAPLAAGSGASQHRRRVAWALGVLLFVGLTAALSALLDESTGIDWYHSFRPAAHEVFALRTPYTVDFQNPPWALIPILPFALLPPTVGRAAFLLVSLAGFTLFAYRMGARPLVLGLFLISPPVLHSLINANIDWLALLGLLLPPQIGLLLVVIKPQIGMAVAVFWLVEAWRTGGFREVVRVFWPLTTLTALSFVIFGLWPLTFRAALGLWWNASFWPASIPVGLALLAAAIRQRRLEYAMAASPCLSPYVLLHAWSGALATLLRSPLEMSAAVIGLWIVILIRMGVLAL